MSILLSQSTKLNIMETFKKIILAIAVMGFFTACNSTEEFDIQNDPAFKHHENNRDSLGFNIVFIGEYQYIGPDEQKCPGLFKVINTGEGTGTHFKKLTTYFEFCVDGNSNYPLGYIDAYFTDEDGDVLEVTIESGQVLPGRVPGIPNFGVSYFKDPFLITGGTGKFAGATGKGYTNDYNFLVNEEGYNFPTKTRHHWKGKIVLKKGNSPS